jgi:uncharacterized protein YxjI
MPLTATCQCGSSYRFKDEYAGKTVKCPKCGHELRVPTAETPDRQQSDPAFDRDLFLLRQKHFSVSQKYYVWDEQGQTILFIERPAHVLRNLVAVLAGIIAGIAFGAFWGYLASLPPMEWLRVLLGCIAVSGGLSTLIVVAILLSHKRHITFYRDDTKRERLLEILQDKKAEIITATFTVRDPQGEVLARFRKNYLYDLLRKRWDCFAPDGSLLCVAKEDSVILSLLRRVLGPLFGILRTNFIILRGATETVIGEFNRKFHILDRYVLDMRSDPGRLLDRRIALALGVMLDTGERR